LVLGGRNLNAQIVVIVNRGNPVKSFSMTELKRIYLGDITHWQSNDENKTAIILIDERHNSKIATKFYTNFKIIQQKSRIDTQCVTDFGLSYGRENWKNLTNINA